MLIGPLDRPFDWLDAPCTAQQPLHAWSRLCAGTGIPSAAMPQAKASAKPLFCMQPWTYPAWKPRPGTRSAAMGCGSPTAAVASSSSPRALRISSAISEASSFGFAAGRLLGFKPIACRWNRLAALYNDQVWPMEGPSSARCCRWKKLRRQHTPQPRGSWTGRRRRLPRLLFDGRRCHAVQLLAQSGHAAKQPVG